MTRDRSAAGLHQVEQILIGLPGDRTGVQSDAASGKSYSLSHPAQPAVLQSNRGDASRSADTTERLEALGREESTYQSIRCFLLPVYGGLGEGRGKPYANVIDDCVSCEHAIETEDGRVFCGA